MVPIWSFLSFGYFAKWTMGKMDDIGTTDCSMLANIYQDVLLVFSAFEKLIFVNIFGMFVPCVHLQEKEDAS